MRPPLLVSGPASAPVTLDQIKEHVSVDYSDDNIVLSSLLNGAVAYLDGYSGVLGRCLVNQTWRQDFHGWDDELRLPFPDVSSIVSVKYLDEDSVLQTVTSSLYELAEDERGAFVRFRESFTSPSLDSDSSYPVQVEFIAGYGDPSDVPGALKVAIMQLVATWYENRGAIEQGELPPAFNALIAPYRRVCL